MINFHRRCFRLLLSYMKISLVLGFLLAVSISLPEAKAAAPTFSVLATLGASPNGYTPNTAILGSDGNIYGTTVSGGTSGEGTVYKLSTTGSLTTLYSFTGTSDGGAPAGPLVEGTDGNYYGTTTKPEAPASRAPFFASPRWHVDDASRLQ